MKGPDVAEPVLPINGVKRFVPVARIERACAVCRWSAMEQNDLVCRRLPPQVTFMQLAQMMQTPNGPRPTGAMQIVPFTSFPVMRKDQWCGEFSDRGGMTGR